MNAATRQKILDKQNGVCPPSKAAPEPVKVDLEANLKKQVTAMATGGLINLEGKYDPKVEAILNEKIVDTEEGKVSLRDSRDGRLAVSPVEEELVIP